jgi:hypothetical protein
VLPTAKESPWVLLRRQDRGHLPHSFKKHQTANISQALFIWREPSLNKTKNIIALHSKGGKQRRLKKKQQENKKCSSSESYNENKDG